MLVCASRKLEKYKCCRCFANSLLELVLLHFDVVEKMVRDGVESLCLLLHLPHLPQKCIPLRICLVVCNI